MELDKVILKSIPNSNNIRLINTILEKKIKSVYEWGLRVGKGWGSTADQIWTCYKARGTKSMALVQD